MNNSFKLLLVLPISQICTSGETTTLELFWIQVIEALTVKCRGHEISTMLSINELLFSDVQPRHHFSLRIIIHFAITSLTPSNIRQILEIPWRRAWLF